MRCGNCVYKNYILLMACTIFKMLTLLYTGHSRAARRNICVFVAISELLLIGNISNITHDQIIRSRCKRAQLRAAFETPPCVHGHIYTSYTQSSRWHSMSLRVPGRSLRQEHTSRVLDMPCAAYCIITGAARVACEHAREGPKPIHQQYSEKTQKIKTKVRTRLGSSGTTWV